MCNIAKPISVFHHLHVRAWRTYALYNVCDCFLKAVTLILCPWSQVFVMWRSVFIITFLIACWCMLLMLRIFATCKQCSYHWSLSLKHVFCIWIYFIWIYLICTLALFPKPSIIFHNFSVQCTFVWHFFNNHSVCSSSDQVCMITMQIVLENTRIKHCTSMSYMRFVAQFMLQMYFLRTCWSPLSISVFYLERSLKYSYRL